MIARAAAVIVAILTVVACLPLALAGSAWLDGVSASRDFSQSAALPTGGSIDIESTGSGIELMPGPAGTVSLAQTVSVRALTPDLARRALDNLPHSRLETVGGGVTVKLAEDPLRPLTALGFSEQLRVSVPVDAPVKVSGAAGAVEATGLHGDLDIQLAAGTVHLSEVDVTHSVVVRSAAGAIAFSGHVESNAVLDLETVNGAISARVPAGTDARFAASTVNGVVDAPGSSRAGPVQSATGVLGGTGSAVITLRATNGAIHLDASGSP